MKNNNAADALTYEAFLGWHVEATARLQDGEELAAPSQKFFEHWRRNRLQDMIRDAMSADRLTETAILVDLREAWVAEQKKRNPRTFAAVEQGIRDVYAGNNPYLAGPVTVEVL